MKAEGTPGALHEGAEVIADKLRELYIERERQNAYIKQLEEHFQALAVDHVRKLFREGTTIREIQTKLQMPARVVRPLISDRVLKDFREANRIRKAKERRRSDAKNPRKILCPVCSMYVGRLKGGKVAKHRSYYQKHTNCEHEAPGFGCRCLCSGSDKIVPNGEGRLEN